MNIWTEKSIQLANQHNYLDLLYKIYPMSSNLRRELDQKDINAIEYCLNNKQSIHLLEILLKQDVFPIKDSYVAYLKRDKSAILRNPNTVERLSGMLYEMGLQEIIEKTTAPKETNRQIGPLFKNWIDKGFIGCDVTDNKKIFLSSENNIIFNTNDLSMQTFANNYLGYTRNKGLDFIGKFNNTYVIGEAKFLTDFSGHQNAQFEDAIQTLNSQLSPTDKKVIKIAILDGVLYIKSNNKMHNNIIQNFDEHTIILSAVLLRDFLYSL